MQNSPKTVPSSVKHSLRREAGSKVTLDVEVDADRLKRAADAAFERHVQRANIPGFRPGKAPRGMYERAYGKEHLWEDAADDLMDQTYREIVEAEGLEPIDRPNAKLTQLRKASRSVIRRPSWSARTSPSATTARTAPRSKRAHLVRTTSTRPSRRCKK